MTDSNLLADLIAYSAQCAVIAVLGGLLPALLRVEVPGIRYTFYRALLAICFVLPFVQGRQALPDTPAGVVTMTTAIVGVTAVPGSAVSASDIPWTTILGVLIACGIAIRGLWIAAGLVRLGRLRRAGFSLPACQEHDEMQRVLGTRAEIRYVVGLGQPVTFGMRRPLVLLPDVLRSHPAHIQRAVLGHELIHVQRGDWAWLLGEEVVRAVFWFHPGIWWLVSRVQLAREEVVDELAMLLAGTRRGYIEALAAFADETPLVPVAAFARRRHLFRRMRLISREVSMSSSRVVLSSVVMALVVGAGAWYAVGAFPLQQPPVPALLTDIGPLEKQARPITPENPLPRRTYSIDPIYPPEATAVEANAMVTLMITLNGLGRVAEVRRLGVAPIASPVRPGAETVAMRNALEALVSSAADAVRQWIYEPPAEAPLSIRVSIGFSSTAPPRLMAHNGWSFAVEASAGRAGRGGPGLAGAPPAPPPPPPPGTLPPAAWAADAVRIGGNVMSPTKVKHVNPAYPAIAQSAKVQGVVIVEARIGPDGKVSNARVLRSIPLLDQAALDAVMQWEFTPTLLNGVPVPVMMTMTVQFTLT